MPELIYVPPYPLPFPWHWASNKQCKHCYFEDQSKREGRAYVQLGFFDRRNKKSVVCTYVGGPSACPYKQGWEERAEELEVLFVMKQTMLPEQDIPRISGMSFSLEFSTFLLNLTGFLEEVK